PVVEQRWRLRRRAGGGRAQAGGGLPRTSRVLTATLERIARTFLLLLLVHSLSPSRTRSRSAAAPAAKLRCAVTLFTACARAAARRRLPGQAGRHAPGGSPKGLAPGRAEQNRSGRPARAGRSGVWSSCARREGRQASRDCSCGSQAGGAARLDRWLG